MLFLTHCGTASTKTRMCVEFEIKKKKNPSTTTECTRLNPEYRIVPLTWVAGWMLRVFDLFGGGYWN